MSCFNPISATNNGLQSNGKNKIVFTGAKSQYDDNHLKLPCGKCIGCLRNRSREWAIRCVHESKLHQDNSFITLTYRPEDLPEGGSLNVADFQGFMKRLRRYAEYNEKHKTKIRFMQCGEYGPKLQRPHHHALLFGYDFHDKKLWKHNGRGQRIYTSETLERLWGKGFCTIGNVTQQSAEYVARYTLKKHYGENAKTHYGDKKPEYLTMSRKPGIGHGWYQKWKTDIYPKGILVFNAVKQMPPRYYDTLYKAENPEQIEQIKLDRKSRANKVRVEDTINGKIVKVSNNDSFRLPVREKIVQSKMRLLKRFYEDS